MPSVCADLHFGAAYVSPVGELSRLLAMTAAAAANAVAQTTADTTRTRLRRTQELRKFSLNAAA